MPRWLPADSCPPAPRQWTPAPRLPAALARLKQPQTPCCPIRRGHTSSLVSAGRLAPGALLPTLATPLHTDALSPRAHARVWTTSVRHSTRASGQATPQQQNSLGHATGGTPALKRRTCPRITQTCHRRTCPMRRRRSRCRNAAPGAAELSLLAASWPAESTRPMRHFWMTYGGACCLREPGARARLTRVGLFAQGLPPPG
jgi:hypothetical protein